MEEILDFIKENKLIKKGEVIGVGVSGGVDSMCLLHFLNANKEKLDIDVAVSNAIYEGVYTDITPKELLSKLMNRKLKEEERYV